MKSVAPIFATTSRRTSEFNFNGSNPSVMSPSSNACLTALKIYGKSFDQSIVPNLAISSSKSKFVSLNKSLTKSNVAANSIATGIISLNNLKSPKSSKILSCLTSLNDQTSNLIDLLGS